MSGAFLAKGFAQAKLLLRFRSDEEARECSALFRLEHLALPCVELFFSLLRETRDAPSFPLDEAPSLA